MSDDAKVIAFPGTADPLLPLGSQPQPDVVAMFEGMLAEALVGRIQSAAVVALLDDGVVSTHYKFADTSPEGSAHVFVGALETLKFRLLADMYAVATPFEASEATDDDEGGDGA